MTDRLEVEIWSDVMCPWCAIGYTQFAQAVKQLAGELSVEVRWMPFELNPDMPAAGRDQVEYLSEAYGRSAEEVAEMRAGMEKTAARAGFAMPYAGPADSPPPPMMWNTFEAHKLLRWALANAGPEVQTRVKLALFRAHFQQRLNVSDRAVLVDIAAAEGLDREAAAAALDDDALSMAVRLEERRARESGITSVPSFVVNGRYILQGANEPEVFRSALLRLASMEAAA